MLQIISALCTRVLIFTLPRVHCIGPVTSTLCTPPLLLILHPFFVFQLGMLPCSLCTPVYSFLHLIYTTHPSHINLTFFCFVLGLFYILLVALPLSLYTPHLLHAPHSSLLHSYHIFVSHFYPSFPPF